MPSSPIKVGFVGLSARGGWASRTHGPSLSLLSDKYTLTAISTSSAESASQTVDKFTKSTGHPIKAYHGNSDGIANDPDVELVAVSVKAPDHKKTTLPAINAGKDVFLEWPAGTGLAETVELAEAARKQGVRSIVGLQGRQSLTLKKVLAQFNRRTRYIILNKFTGTGITRRNRSSAIYDDCK
jgi:predicted dehydrogenase